MSTVIHRPAVDLAPGRIDPRADWPVEARRLREDLAALYGEGDALADVAGGWVARWPSANTRRAYARGCRAWEAYARQRGVHPLNASFPLADAFARYLETAPTMVRVRGRPPRRAGPDRQAALRRVPGQRAVLWVRPSTPTRCGLAPRRATCSRGCCGRPSTPTSRPRRG